MRNYCVLLFHLPMRLIGYARQSMDTDDSQKLVGGSRGGMPH